MIRAILAIVPVSGCAGSGTLTITCPPSGTTSEARLVQVTGTAPPQRQWIECRTRLATWTPL